VKFLADMGISPLTVASLNQQGYDAKHLNEEGLYKMADDAILEKARREGRILLTADLDFGYLMAISRSRMPSIILFRLQDMRPASVNAHLVEVIQRFASELAAGIFITATQRRIRVRQLPIRR
jgi:predicted nuclease of predicted toxin-antitoxin system